MDERVKKAIREAFDDGDLRAEDLPRIDLYMDQILTLLDEGLAGNKRGKEDRLVTKTMVNNYSKEHLIMPVKGKKYTREQVVQLLCVLNLKQNFSLGDVKTLMGVEEKERVDYGKVYAQSVEMKERLRREMPAWVEGLLNQGEGLPEGERTLLTALTLSSAAVYLRRICEKLIDGRE